MLLLPAPLKWLLIAFGLARCGRLHFAIYIKWITPSFGGLVDYTPSCVPALRHRVLWNWNADGGGGIPTLVAI
jgi:hypothetical protein